MESCSSPSHSYSSSPSRSYSSSPSRSPLIISDPKLHLQFLGIRDSACPKKKAELVLQLFQSINQIQEKASCNRSKEESELLECSLKIVELFNSEKAFTSLNFSGKNMSELNLNLLGEKGIALNLSHSKFDNTILIATDLSDSILIEATFINAIMDYTILSKADLRGANLSVYTMDHAVFGGTIISQSTILPRHEEMQGLVIISDEVRGRQDTRQADDFLRHSRRF